VHDILNSIVAETYKLLQQEMSYDKLRTHLYALSLKAKSLVRNLNTNDNKQFVNKLNMGKITHLAGRGEF
jgi:hypothetical protein